MRLAWFSPLPPVRSGIADYSAEILPRIAVGHAVDVFVATAAERAARRDGPRALDAHEFPWRHARAPYDLVVYQLGNARCHEYQWPYLCRYPGLVVLHDAQLHHSRAAALLRRRRAGDYRAELAFNHPDLPASAAEIGLSGFDGPLYYLWPMLRTAIAAARLVAVHNARLAADLADGFPGRPVAAIRMGVAAVEPGADAGAAMRARFGIDAGAGIVAAFGGVTPEKRIVPLLRALGVVRHYRSDIRLLLVGQSHPHFDVAAAARDAGVEDLVVATGFVDAGALGACLRAADVASCLRWPTARETSASWLRCLAAGLPTLVTDLAQQADVPVLDPRSWTVSCADPALSRPDPVAVAIPVDEEAHTLVLALKRLLCDGALRGRLSLSARGWWAAHHTLDLMAADYERVLDAAARTPDPAGPLPPHARPDGLEHTRALLAPFADGIPADRFLTSGRDA